jgi:assimilatory nitrate reductase electron transfer subunit
MTARRVVVIGHGMAGARLAGELRRHDPVAERVAVTVVGDEPHAAYNRVLLSGVLAGSLDLDALRLQEISQPVDLRLGIAVTSVDRSQRQVRLADDTAVDYDALVLATGARPWLPDVDGLLTEDGTLAAGVFAFRNHDDCTRIVAGARPGVPVVVLGGGLLGLEAARGLAGRGCLVTVVHPGGHILDRQVDPAGSHLLRRVLERLGIEFRVGTTAVRYVPGDGLKLADGSHVPGEMVVVSAGVRAETGLARAAGLAVDRGVLVDDALRTNDPRVHAIGDCAQHASTGFGLVQPAFDQAAVLAARLTGADPAARYRGTPVVTRLKAKDVDLASMGDVHLDPAGDHPPGVEVICVQDSTRGRYGKLVLREDRVAGAILLGLPDAAANIIQLFDSQAPVPGDRLGLLLGRALPAEQSAGSSAAALPDNALVCRCNTVDKGRIVAAWQDGARDVPAIATSTRATTGCSSCRNTVTDIVNWLASNQSV